MIIVTGGAGFIGSNFILDWLAEEKEAIINLDKLTYAGNLDNLKPVKNHPMYHFIHGDINNRELLQNLFVQHKPRAIVNFAAESHVDRSIHDPEVFINTNINGTFNLLEVSRIYWQSLDETGRDKFRFVHVSTDEVFGSLGPNDSAFTETTPYAPNSPYSASKASSDHLVRAYFHSYSLPTLTTNCSNNYGPLQFPEKLIPLVILKAIQGKDLPIYGDGLNIRDWLYVTDHCAALRLILATGKLGETYTIGGNNEKTNLEVVKTICTILDELHPSNKSYIEQIAFIKDRPGHDRRYAINAHKIKQQLGWQAKESFEQGIRKTITWYLNNMEWIDNVLSGHYRQIDK